MQNSVKCKGLFEYKEKNSHLPVLILGFFNMKDNVYNTRESDKMLPNLGAILKLCCFCCWGECKE